MDAGQSVNAQLIQAARPRPRQSVPYASAKPHVKGLCRTTKLRCVHGCVNRETRKSRHIYMHLHWTTENRWHVATATGVACIVCSCGAGLPKGQTRCACAYAAMLTAPRQRTHGGPGWLSVSPTGREKRLRHPGRAPSRWLFLAARRAIRHALDRSRKCRSRRRSARAARGSTSRVRRARRCCAVPRSHRGLLVHAPHVQRGAAPGFGSTGCGSRSWCVRIAGSGSFAS